jgi:IgA Peptidase M64
MSCTAKWTKSLRLNFSLSDGGIALISFTGVEIMPPPGDTLEEKSGFSINLSYQSSEVFYSRTIHNPADKSAEAFGKSENDPITIETLEKRDMEFSVLIPDPGAVFRAEIVNIPYSDEEGVTPEKEVFSFTIKPDEEIAPPAAAIESLEDGRVAGVRKIVDHGSDNECWNLAILSEGYRSDEIDKFKSDVSTFINYMSEFTPFTDFWHRTNVYRVDVESDESGADLPTNCGGGNPVNVRTYFNATFCGSPGIQRLLVVDTSVVRKVWQEHVPRAHVALVIVNSNTYGGSGASNIPVFSTESSSKDIGIHELGHSFFNLADEYPGNELNFDPDLYPNVTKNTVREQIEWADLIDQNTPIPTSVNDCPNTGEAFTHSVPTGTVGLFEGALYRNCNIYRAENTCLMRNFSVPKFCAVCERAIRQKLQSLLQIEPPVV